MEDGLLTSISETCVHHFGVSREKVEGQQVYMQDVFQDFDEIMEEFENGFASNEDYRHPFSQRFGNEVLSLLLKCQVTRSI